MNRIDEQSPEGVALRGVMERSMRGVHPDVRLLEEQAVRKGRRLRARRRAGFVTGLAAASVVAVVGVVQLGPSGSEAPDAIDPAVPGTTIAPEPGPTAADWWSLPADQMLDRLQPLLPAGVEVVDAEFRLPEDELAPGQDNDILEGDLVVTLDAPATGGTSQAQLRFHPPAHELPPPPEPSTDASGDMTIHAAGPTPGELTTCDREWLDKKTECSELQDDEGRVYGRVTRFVMGDVVTLGVDLLTTDHGVVSLAVANSAEEKWTPPASAERPALTVEQLQEIAADPVWTS